jgi:hypothetical protein
MFQQKMTPTAIEFIPPILMGQIPGTAGNSVGPTAGIATIIKIAFEHVRLPWLLGPRCIQQ